MVEYSKEELIGAWNLMFDENPWLEGWEANGDCDVFCCPGSPPDWGVMQQAKTYNFLLGGNRVTKLKRSLHQ